MAIDKKYTVKLKRRRLGKTNYRARLKLLVSKRIRLIIRKSLNNIIAQLVSYENKGDNVLVNVDASKLRKYGWKFHLGNLPSAYLTGLLLGIVAKKKKIKEAILDLGVNPSIKGSSSYALLKGALDSGLMIKCDEKVLPNYDRVSGKHIAVYALKIKSSPSLYNQQFSKYLKYNINPEDMPKQFEQIKTKILQENA